MAKRPRFTGSSWDPTPEEEALMRAARDELVTVNRARAGLDAREQHALTVAAQVAQAQMDRCGSDSDYMFPVRSLAAELGAAVRESSVTVQHRMFDALVLTARFPATTSALQEARITGRHAGIIREHGDHLPDGDVLATYERQAVVFAEDATPSQLRMFAKTLADHLHPEPLTARHERAKTTRGAWMRDLDDGMAEIAVVHTAAVVHGIHDRLTQMGKTIESVQRRTEREAREARDTDAAARRARRAEAEREEFRAAVARITEHGHSGLRQLGILPGGDADTLDREDAATPPRRDAFGRVVDVADDSSRGVEGVGVGADADTADRASDTPPRRDAFGRVVDVADDSSRGVEIAGIGTDADTADRASDTPPRRDVFGRVLADESGSVRDAASPEAADMDAGSRPGGDGSRSDEEMIVAGVPGPVSDDPADADTTTSTAAPAGVVSEDAADTGAEMPPAPAAGSTAHPVVENTAGGATPANSATENRIDKGTGATPSTARAGATREAGTDATTDTDTDVPTSRTLDEVRADIAADLLLSATPTAHVVCDETGKNLLDAIRGNVQVTIPVAIITTAGTGADTTGISAEDEEDAGDAFLAGYGPIDPNTARRLAGAASGWDRLFRDPDTGVLLTVDRYTPSEQQKRFLLARDETCRFPCCRTPVRRADADHTIDWQHGGETNVANLATLCRAHHMVKHHTPWTVKQHPGGVLEWESPLGTTYTDVPQPTVRFTASTDTGPPGRTGPPPF